MERFACPSPDFRGRYRCIDDRSLCDGFFDCPSREDENPEMCLFYKTVRRQFVIRNLIGVPLFFRRNVMTMFPFSSVFCHENELYLCWYGGTAAGCVNNCKPLFNIEAAVEAGFEVTATIIL